MQTEKQNKAANAEHIMKTRRGIAISLAYSAAIAMGILLYTAGPKTLEAIKGIKPFHISAVLLLFVMMQIFEVRRLQVLTKAMGTEISFPYGLRVILSCNFLASITPTISGGEPLMVYLLKDKGIGVGKGTAVVAVRGLLQLSLIAMAGPIIIFFRRDLLPTAGYRVVFDAVAASLAVAIGFSAYGLTYPKKMKNHMKKIARLLTRIPFLKSRSERIIHRIDDWIEELNYSLKYFIKKRKTSLLLGAVYTVFFMLSNYMIAYFLLQGLNNPIPAVKVVMVQIVLWFILYFSPTPGGSGVAEAGFYMLFSPLAPEKHLLGLLVILWRIFTTYIGLFAGGIVIIKTLGFERIEYFAEVEVPPEAIED